MAIVCLFVLVVVVFILFYFCLFLQPNSFFSFFFSFLFLSFRPLLLQIEVMCSTQPYYGSFFFLHIFNYPFWKGAI